MINGRKTWLELIDEVMGVQGEGPDGFVANLDGQLNVPYYDRTDVEACLYDVSLLMLRQLAVSSPDLLGPDAIVERTVSSGNLLNQNIINCLSAKIDGVSAVEVTPAQWLQNKETSSKIYSFFSGAVFFSGGTIGVFEFIVEPPLFAWETNGIILPPGLDSRRVTMTAELLELQDYLPAGRI